MSQIRLADGRVLPAALDLRTGARVWPPESLPEIQERRRRQHEREAAAIAAQLHYQRHRAQKARKQKN